MSNSRTKRTLQNASVGAIYQIVLLILNFVSRTIFIQVLGKEFLGINSIFYDVLNLLSMADLGFSTAMSYTFYKPLADEDHDRIAALINFYKKIYNAVALIVGAVGLLLVPALPYIIKTDKPIEHLTLYYLIALGNSVLSYLFVYKTTLLTADQKNYVVTLANMIRSFVTMIIQVAVLIIWKNYALYLLVNLITGLANNILLSHRVEKEYSYIKDIKSDKLVEQEQRKKIFSNMKSVFIYKVSNTLFDATDNIIISTILGAAVTGVYSNYLTLSNKLLLVVQIIFSAMTASIGNLVASEGEKKRLEVFNAAQSFCFILCGIITCGYFTLVGDVIHIWLGGFGRGFELPLLTVCAISINTYMGCILLPLWTFRDATGIYNKTKYVMLYGAILNIVLSIVMGKMIGLAGVIFASAISRVLSYVWYEPRILFKEYFGIGAGKYFISLIKNFALVVGTTAILYWGSSKYRVNSIGALLLKILVVGSICVVMYMVLYGRTEGAQIIRNKIRQSISNRKAAK